MSQFKRTRFPIFHDEWSMKGIFMAAESLDKPPTKMSHKRLPKTRPMAWIALRAFLSLTSAVLASTPIPTTLNLSPSDFFSISLEKQVQNITKAAISFPEAKTAEEEEKAKKSISLSSSIEYVYSKNLSNNSSEEYYQKYEAFSTDWRDSSNAVWVSWRGPGLRNCSTIKVNIDRQYKFTGNWFKIADNWTQILDPSRKPNFIKTDVRLFVNRYDYENNTKTWVATEIFDFVDPKNPQIRRLMPAVAMYPKDAKSVGNYVFPLYFGVKSEDALVDERLRVSYSVLDPTDLDSAKNFILSYNYLDGSVFYSLKCYQTYKTVVDYDKGEMMSCVHDPPFIESRRILREGADDSREDESKEPRESQKASFGSLKGSKTDYFQFLKGERLGDVIDGKVSFTRFAVGHGFICSMFTLTSLNKCIPVFLTFKIAPKLEKSYSANLELDFMNPESFNQKPPYTSIMKISIPLNMFTKTEILYSNAKIGQFAVFGTSDPTLLVISTKRFYVYKLNKNATETASNKKISLLTKSDNISCPGVRGVDISRLFPVLEFHQGYFVAKFMQRGVGAANNSFRVRYWVHFTKVAGTGDFKVYCQAFDVNQIITLNQGSQLIYKKGLIKMPTYEDRKSFNLSIKGLSKQNSAQPVKAVLAYSSRVASHQGELVELNFTRNITLMSNGTPCLELPVRQFEVVQPDILAIEVPETGLLGRFPSIYVPNSLNNGSSVYEEDLTFFGKSGKRLDSRTVLRYLKTQDPNFEVIITAETPHNPQNASLMIFNCTYPQFSQRVCNLSISYPLTTSVELERNRNITVLILGQGTHLATIFGFSIKGTSYPEIVIYGVKKELKIEIGQEKFSQIYEHQTYTLAPTNPYEILIYSIAKGPYAAEIWVGRQKVNFDPGTGNVSISAHRRVFVVYTAPVVFIEGITMAPPPPGVTRKMALFFRFSELATSSNTTQTEGALIQQLYYCGIDRIMIGKVHCSRKDYAFRTLFFGKRPLIMCPASSSHFIQSSVDRTTLSRLFLRRMSLWRSNFEVLAVNSHLKILRTVCLGIADVVQLEVYDYLKRQRQLLYINADSRILDKRQREVSKLNIDESTTEVFSYGIEGSGYIRTVAPRPGDTLGTLKTFKISNLGYMAFVNSSDLIPNKNNTVKVSLTTDDFLGKAPLQYPITVSVIGQKKEDFNISTKAIENTKTPKIRLNEPIDLDRLLNITGIVANLELSTTNNLKNGGKDYEFRSRKYKISSVSTAPLISGTLSGGEAKWIDSQQDRQSHTTAALTAQNYYNSTFIYILKIKTKGDWMITHYRSSSGTDALGLAYQPNSFIKADGKKTEEKSDFVASFPLGFEKAQNMQLMSFSVIEDSYNSDSRNRHVYLAIHYNQTIVVKNGQNGGFGGVETLEGSDLEQTEQEVQTVYFIKVYRSELAGNSNLPKMTFLVSYTTPGMVQDDHYGVVPISNTSFYLYTTSEDNNLFKLAYFTPDPKTSKFSTNHTTIAAGKFKVPPSFLEFHNMAYRGQNDQIVQTLVGIYGSYQRGYLSLVWTFPGSTRVYYALWFTLSPDLILQITKMSCKDEVGQKPKISQKPFEINFQCYAAAIGSFDYVFNYTATLEKRLGYPQVYKSSKVLAKLTSPDFFFVEEIQRTGDVIVMKMDRLNPDVQIDVTIASKCPYILVVYRLSVSSFPWAVYSCLDLGIESKADTPSFSLYAYDDVYVWMTARRNFLNVDPTGGAGLEQVSGVSGGYRRTDLAPTKTKILTKIHKFDGFEKPKKSLKSEFEAKTNLKESEAGKKKSKTYQTSGLRLSMALTSEISVHTVKNSTLIIKSPSFTFKNTTLTLQRLNQNKMLQSLGLLTSMCLTPFVITFSVNPLILYPVISVILAVVIYVLILRDLIKKNKKILKYLFSIKIVYVDHGEAERSHLKREKRLKRLERERKMRRVLKLVGYVRKLRLAEINEEGDDGSDELEEEGFGGMSEDKARGPPNYVFLGDSGSGQVSYREEGREMDREGDVERVMKYEFKEGSSSEDEGLWRDDQRLSDTDFLLT